MHHQWHDKMIDFEALRRVQTTGDFNNWLNSVVGSNVTGKQYSDELSDSYMNGAEQFFKEPEEGYIDRMLEQQRKMQEYQTQMGKQLSEENLAVFERQRSLASRGLGMDDVMSYRPQNFEKQASSGAIHNWQKYRERQSPNRIFPWMLQNHHLRNRGASDRHASDRNLQQYVDQLVLSSLNPTGYGLEEQPTPTTSTTPKTPKKKKQPGRLTRFKDKQGNWHDRDESMTYEDQWKKIHDKMGYARK